MTLRFHRLKLPVETRGRDVTICHVSPRLLAITDTERERADELIRETVSKLFGASLHGSGELPLLLQLPELYVDIDVLIEVLRQAPPGLVVVAGLRGNHNFGWYTGDAALAMVDSPRVGVHLELPDFGLNWFRTCRPDALLNLLAFGVRHPHTKEVILGLRPKFAPAPTQEVSARPEHNVTPGDWVTYVDLEPPREPSPYGFALLPLVCSEYFESTADGLRVDALLRTPAMCDPACVRPVDIVPVVNVCRDERRPTGWPAPFQDAMKRLHHGETPIGTTLAVTTLTCPTAFSFTSDPSANRAGAPSGIVIPSNYFTRPLATASDTRLSFFSTEQDRWLQGAELPAKLEPHGVFFLGVDSREDSEAEADLLVYRYELARFRTYHQYRIPIKDVRVHRLTRRPVEHT